MVRFFGFLFAASFVLFLAGMGVVGYVLWNVSKDLPDYAQLRDYEPPVMTRVHASDGTLLAEYAKQRRLYLPVQAVPRRLVEAFLSAEDKNFYSHIGVDFTGIARAVVTNIENYRAGRRMVGASTITQQVAKNFLLTNDRTVERKLKEALLALRIEQAFSKDEILELYLNEIFLGLGSYGVAGAALQYFDKSVHELTLAEAAYFAALPKAPNNYHPFRHPERAIERRNWVIDRMVANGFVSVRGSRSCQGAAAQRDPARHGCAASGRRLLCRRGTPDPARQIWQRQTLWRRACRCGRRLCRKCR
jgi:penicillin-binding protein 1A